MGQTIGRAPLLTPPRHFVNLPKTCIYELWEAFNDIAEGFGLTSEEMCEILRVVLKDVLGYSEKKARRRLALRLPARRPLTPDRLDSWTAFLAHCL